MPESTEKFSEKAEFLRKELNRVHGEDERLVESEYGLNYFEQLRTEWSLLNNPEQAIGPGGQQRLKELFDKKAEDLTWSDLYAFERFLTHALPFVRLKR